MSRRTARGFSGGEILRNGNQFGFLGVLFGDVYIRRRGTYRIIMNGTILFSGRALIKYDGEEKIIKFTRGNFFSFKKTISASNLSISITKGSINFSRFLIEDINSRMSTSKFRKDLVIKMRNDLIDVLPIVDKDEKPVLIVIQEMFCISAVKKIIAVRPCVKKIVAVALSRHFSKNHSSLLSRFVDRIFVLSGNFSLLRNIIKKYPNCVIHIHDVRRLERANGFLSLLHEFRKHISKIVYDLHDIFAIQHPNGTHVAGIQAEKIMCNLADVLITPNTMSSDFVRKRFDKQTETFYLYENFINFPKKTIGSKSNFLDIIYEGGVVARPESHRFYNKIFENILKNKQARLSVYSASTIYKFLDYLNSERFRLSSAVRHSEILKRISESDVSFCGYNRIKSLKNELIGDRALPNKLFESIAGGTPIMTMKFTNLERFVRENNFGFVIDDNMVINFDKEEVLKVKENVVKRRFEFMMERQTDSLMKLYLDV